MQVWRWLVRDRDVTLGDLDLLRGEPGSFHERWKMRVYWRIHPFRVHTAPMVERMISGRPATFSMASASTDGETKFHVFVRQQEGEGNGAYLSLVQEPLEVVQMAYPEAEQIAPPLGVVQTGARWVLTNVSYDAVHVGYTFASMIRDRKDEDTFGLKALKKAGGLLQRMCSRHGFEFSETQVTKGSLVISRKDCALTIGGSFRCLTSDYNLPRDDQVVQKLLALTSEKSMQRIATLSSQDKLVIKEAMNG